MKKIILVCITFLFMSYWAFSQKFDDKRTRDIVEPILTTIINSEVFDSVYHSNKVCFLINDLIPEDNPWNLYSKKYKVKYITEKQTRKVKQYFVLGNFTLDWQAPNPKSVRVQIVLMPKDIYLNFRLLLENNKWIIDNYHVFPFE